MKILHKGLVPNGPGSVKMLPEEAEDLWLAYNLIAKGDTVLALTYRKVIREADGESASRGRSYSERVKLTLEIKTESVDYDKDGSVLRVQGKNVLKNEHVKFGAFHTLEIELLRTFELRKKVWDLLSLEQVASCMDPSASADLVVVLLQEGLAQIFLVGNSVITARARIEASIPRKHRPGIGGYEKALTKFFEDVTRSFIYHVNFKVVRCLVIASPGFTKDQFHHHLLLEAERRQCKPILKNKSRIILVHTTSGYEHSLREVLDDPSVMTIIKDTKVAREVQTLKNFSVMLSKDPTRVCYGSKHVEVAHEQRAIQTLLITDELFRNSDEVMRGKYIALVNSVKTTGGTVLIFSSMHASGEQLRQLTGIAAILRFPLPDLDEIEL
ncbi:Protein PELOTA like [Actinidia chinensis var. chinensis]|uniref:Protein pelota homolog n=1 Tax=Actinidia chinensis var. chinensis TaxID=1590841 RepID=A0A2R6R2Q4_ACTCC|nr:Protein PELOTA like [Actinidia chinensis var. chinensis]